jgi:hypothetical protein
MTTPDNSKLWCEVSAGKRCDVSRFPLVFFISPRISPQIFPTFSPHFGILKDVRL